MKNTEGATTSQSWHAIISKYNKPQVSKSVWQIINSLGSYILLWILMVQLMKVSYWLTIPLIFLAAGFLVRIFIIFHDCGHGSFFKSKNLNLVIGNFFGILAFTPYLRWTDSHRLHHQTVGNLDKRGFGDVWTLTVDEFQALKPGRRRLYRVFRHPITMLVIGGPLMFVLGNRFTRKWNNRNQRLNIYFTNIMIFGLAAGMSWLIGWQAFLLIQLPVIYLAAIGGVYLFYLQHQYDDVIWSRSEDWDYKEMALHGSSFFKLPGILRWFSGNIGYHHVHHLGPTIPNYKLVRAHKENALFQEVKPITLFKSFHSLKLRLWDEKNQKIITFRELRVMTG